MNGAWDWAGSIVILAGAFLILVSALQQFGVGDALARLNTVSVSSALGFPLVIIGVWLRDLGERGFSLLVLVEVIVAIAASYILGSVGSNVLARSVYRSMASFDRHTLSNALGSIEDRPQMVEKPGKRRRQRKS